MEESFYQTISNILQHARNSVYRTANTVSDAPWEKHTPSSTVPRAVGILSFFMSVNSILAFAFVLGYIIGSRKHRYKYADFSFLI